MPAMLLARLGVLAALVFFTISAGADARPLEQVKAANDLFVIAYEDNKPFSWSADDGTPMGIDVDLAKAIAEKLGVNATVELRMQAERADGDVRTNIIRGTVGGGKTADILMNVPYDPEFARKFDDALIANPYFQQTVALAINPQKIPSNATFEIFRKEKVGVKLASVSTAFRCARSIRQTRSSSPPAETGPGGSPALPLAGPTSPASMIGISDRTRSPTMLMP